MSVKAKIGRALLKLVTWAGVTLAREGVDLIVEKTTSKPSVTITPSRPVLVVDSKFKDALPLQPDVVRDEIRRLRGQQL